MKNTKSASLSLRKLLLSVLVTAPLATLPVPLWGLPSDAASLASQVSSTSGATVGWTSATRVDVTATATNSVIKWVNFGATGMTINSGDVINYALPSASSSVLNMVTGSNATTVNGTLQSNGNIYVLNPNGITIGSTGVITANGVGLSTVPETEYNFLNTGTLTGVENQNIATHAAVNVLNGAVITAASGTGNVWIAAQGANLNGTIDGGAVTVSSVRSGNVTLGDSGNLVVGDVAAHASSLSVTTDGGTITVGNSSIGTSSVTVFGPTVSLTTGGNAAINQYGTFQIGAGSGANATLTTNSGAGDTSLGNVVINGTGTLTVNASGGNVTINSSAGKLAIGGNATGNFVGNATSDLTINTLKTANLSVSSANGNIYAPGTVTASGLVTLNVSGGKDIAYTTASSFGNVTLNLTSGSTFGNVTLVQTKGDMAVPGLTAAAVTANAQAGNMTFSGAQVVSGQGTYTASGNVSVNQAITAGNLTISAGNQIYQTAAINGNNSASGVTLTTTSGNIALESTIGATSAPATLTVSSGKDVIIDGAVQAKSVSVTAAGNLYGNAAIDNTGSTSGSVTLKATSGNLTTTAAGTIGANTAAKTVSLSAGNNANIGGSIAATQSSGTISITGTNDVNVTAASLSSNASKSSSITATNGNVTLGNTTTISGGALTVNAGQKINDSAIISIGANTATLKAGGNVTVTGDLTAGNASISGAYLSGAGNITVAGTTTLTSTDSISLTGPNSDFGTVVISGAPNGATISDINSVTLGDGTAATGNVTINAGNITLGNTASGLVSVAGNLTLNAATNGNISDNTDNTYVGGPLNANTSGTGVITLDGSAGTGVGLNSSYGQVNATAGATTVTVFENTVLNLGNITTAAGGALRAYSASGIINTGVINTGNVTVGAGTASAPGSISLTSGNATIGNQINGTITILDDLHLLNPGSTVTGNYLANNLVVVNNATSPNLLTITPTVYGTTPAINVDLTTTGSNTLNVGQLATTGTVKLTSKTGDIVAGNTSNTFTNVTVQSSGGNVTVYSAKDLTVNTTGVSGSGNASYTSAGNLTIGSYLTSTTLGQTTFAAGSTGSITDSTPGIAITGNVTFTGGSLSVTKSGHNFGGISIDTSANNGNATIVESGTSRFISVKTGKGAFTSTSSNGDIIQTSGTGSGIITSGRVSLNAPNGKVIINDANNAITGNIAISAVNDSTVTNSGAAVLDNVVVSAGNFTVTGAGIKQAAGTTINTYGATKFTTTGNADIVLGNPGNRFGALTLSTGTGNATLKELTTVNLASVAVGGYGNITSESGSIIDSGNVTIGGLATLTAANDITLASSGSDYSTVRLTAGGNASIKDKNDLVMDTSTIGGGLTVNAAGNVTQAGALSVAGPTSFTTGGTLTLNNTANTFGAFRLNTAGDTLIDEATTFNLSAGSISTGRVTINTGGNFITSGTGGSSFTGGTSATDPGLTINATGTIIPGAGSLLVTNYLKVNSPSLKDLSQLSLSGNLNGKQPVNAGTGQYIAPSTP